MDQRAGIWRGWWNEQTSITMLKHFKSEDWQTREGRWWSTFFNTLSGPRSVVMIGTQSKEGIKNIGLFNSLVHLGANPPLMGFILRPTTVERHTYENLTASSHYTINHGSTEMIDKVHQTSAKYERDEDEFEACGFTSDIVDGFNAPFIKESPIRFGLEFREEHFIQANETRLIAGEIKHVFIDDDFIDEDGFIQTSEAKTLLSCGLNAYHTHQFLTRMPYARPKGNTK